MSTIDHGFSVKGERTLWWGGCIWDSFAIPHLVPDEPEVLVATTCQGCGRAHAWVVGRDGPPEGDQVAHFLVPGARMWDDVVFTCSNQRVFCDVPLAVAAALFAAGAALLAELAWYAIIPLALIPLAVRLPVPSKAPVWLQAIVASIYALAPAALAWTLAWKFDLD